MQHLSAASDLGLHCLPITLLGISSLKWVQLVFQASDLIRSTLMGHNIRKRQMTNYHDYDDDEDDYVTDNEDYNDCVNLIQSAVKGHSSRRTRMRDFK